MKLNYEQNKYLKHFILKVHLRKCSPGLPVSDVLSNAFQGCNSAMLGQCSHSSVLVYLCLKAGHKSSFWSIWSSRISLVLIETEDSYFINFLWQFLFLLKGEETLQGCVTRAVYPQNGRVRQRIVWNLENDNFTQCSCIQRRDLISFYNVNPLSAVME